MQIPAAGMATKCTACNARLQVVRESFARMAYHKAEEKSCAQCGNSLGHTLHCPACGVVYPDFLVAADPAIIRRQARDRRRQHFLSSFQGISLSLPSFKSAGAEKATPRYSPQRATTSAKSSSAAASSRRIPILIVSLLVLAAIIGGGYTAYARHKAEQIYVQTYFKTLYGIKTGFDLCSKTNSKIAADWKSAMDGGRPFTPRLAADEEARLGKVKTEVEKILQQLNPPPEKFATSYEQLGKLNGRYAQLHNMTLSQSASLPALTDALGKYTTEFNKQAQELKASFSEEMTEEMKQARLKYKPLKDF
jgi:hypothetical protein